MNVIPTEVLDVYILEPKVFGDHRGWFMPRQSWCAAAAVRYWM